MAANYEIEPTPAEPGADVRQHASSCYSYTITSTFDAMHAAKCENNSKCSYSNLYGDLMGKNGDPQTGWMKE